MQSKPKRHCGQLNGHWDSHHGLLEFDSADGETGKTSRPWLTILMDRYSRCIVGFSVRAEPPSGESVLESLRMGVKRKEQVLLQFGGITNLWECHGAPANLTVDAGQAFRSERLIAASERCNSAFISNRSGGPG